MKHRRSPGKLEAKLARNYCYTHSIWKHRNSDPNEVNEQIYIGTQTELNKEVLANLPEGTRTGTIPEYPQGLVIGDQRQSGYFNVVTLLDETCGE